MYTKSPPAYCVYHLPAVHTIIGKPRHIGKYLQQITSYVTLDVKVFQSTGHKLRQCIQEERAPALFLDTV
jgi:hypothetical protein